MANKIKTFGKRLMRSLNPFRKSRHKTRIKNAHSKTAEENYAPAASYKQPNILDIIGNSDITQIDTMLRAGITAETPFSIKRDDGSVVQDNVANLAISVLEQRAQNLTQAAQKFHPENWQSLAALDQIDAHVAARSGVADDVNKYAHAAAFLHSQEMLDMLGVAHDKRPQFTFSATSLEAIASPENIAALDKYDHAINIAQTLIDHNINHDSFVAGNVSSMAAHVNQAIAARKIHNEGISAQELLEWANDPYLQYHFRFLSDIPGATQYTDDYFKSFEKMLQQEQEAKLAAVKEAQQKLQEEQENHAQQHQQADKIRQALDDYHTLRTVVAQRSFKEEIIDAHPQTFDALNYVDDINDFDAADDAMLFLHEDVLTHIGIDNPNFFIVSQAAARADEIQSMIAQSEQDLHQALELDVNVSIRDALAQSAQKNPSVQKMLDIVAEANRAYAGWDQRYLFDALAKTHRNSQEFLQQPADAMAEKIIAASQNSAVAAKLPYLESIATQTKEFIVVTEASAMIAPALAEDNTATITANDKKENTVEKNITAEKDNSPDDIGSADFTQSYQDMGFGWNSTSSSTDYLDIVEVMKEEKIEMLNQVAIENDEIPRKTFQEWLKR